MVRLQGVIFLLAFACAPGADAATAYFVDAISGNDANSGVSDSQPWQSVTSVNSQTLQPGDQVHFRRGQSHPGNLNLSSDGTSSDPITVSSWGQGTPPVLYQVTIRGDFYVIEDLVFDHQKDSGDTFRIRGGRNCTVRNVTLRNGTSDAFDVDSADGLMLDNVEIHHFLAGSFGSKDDAHGVAATNTDGITIRNSNIHHVSGDSFQSDPNRVPGGISNNILIENTQMWTGPLDEQFNAGWLAGNSPGENAIDTKVLQAGFEAEPRMNIVLRNVTAYGWSQVPELSNRAAFNLKEKINATLDRVTVYNSEIAFRVRGAIGNADTIIQNAVVHDVDIAIRAEDDLENLRIFNSTFGDGIGEMLRHAGGSGGTSSWDVRNNAFISNKPAEADHPTNAVAAPADFENTAARDYRLIAGSALIDQAETITSVTTDRDGQPRFANYDVGAYEFQASSDSAAPRPPTIVED